MSITRTNYSKIAYKYDKNPVREKQIDPEIKLLLQQKSKLKVIDLACGTGSYLKTQSDYYGFDSIQWIGIDRSKDMLSIARKKNLYSTLIHASADNPKVVSKQLIDADYIRNEFSFHHFTNKEQAIKNIYNMLVPNGMMFMVNIIPEYMKHYWVYHYFPEAIEEDKKRFMAYDELYRLLADHKFSVTMNVVTYITQIDFSAILSEAQNRDISQLAIIDDETYHKGIANIKKDMKDDKNMIIDISLLNVKAIKN